MDVEYVRDDFTCPHEECDGKLLLETDFELFDSEHYQEMKAKVQVICESCENTFEIEFSIDSIKTILKESDPINLMIGADYEE